MLMTVGIARQLRRVTPSPPGFAGLGGLLEGQETSPVRKLFLFSPAFPGAKAAPAAGYRQLSLGETATSAGMGVGEALAL